MNMPDPKNNDSGWMAQFANPVAWHSFFTLPAFNGLPLAPKTSEQQAVNDPVASIQLPHYVQQLANLWQAMLTAEKPRYSDKRFDAPAWRNNPVHAFSAGAYLLNSRFLMAIADALPGPEKEKQKMRFSVQQIVDAMSPANFLMSNPEAQQKIIDTKGQSLVTGVTLLLADMQKGRISQTDETAFEVGKNVAITEGAVVFENDLFQLLQYKPLTKTVYEKPLLLVPPCINKFYILDLQPSNSLVRFAVAQGHTVFLVSWRNPDKAMSHVTWDDYVEDGVIKAMDVVQNISGQPQMSALGFCVGGTLLSTALALMAVRGDHPVSSLTLLTSFLDFSDTGVIDVFVDEAEVKKREQAIGNGGLMAGRDFSSAFSSLRANDLIWHYVGSNYLKGEKPPAFDLLYWNADSTNLPGPMFCWYLRNTYLENNLSVPDKVSVGGENIDFGRIDAPTFIYASREDHIVPWTAAYSSTSLLNPTKTTRNRFVLGASGHIAGVINPPAKNKRSYWINKKHPATAETWFAGATEKPGSWWTEWDNFLVKHAGNRTAAPDDFGNGAYRPIESAPGRYVKVKAE